MNPRERWRSFGLVWNRKLLGCSSNWIHKMEWKKNYETYGGIKGGIKVFT